MKRKVILPIVRLSVDELRMLRSSPYDTGSWILTREFPTADRLRDRGLLEFDPNAKGHVRVSSDGEFWAAPVSLTRARSYVQEIRVLREELRPDDASELASALVERLLVETVLDPARGGELARIALSALAATEASAGSDRKDVGSKRA